MINELIKQETDLEKTCPINNVCLVNGTPKQLGLLEIIKEYDLTPSSLDNWIRRINATGSAKECDNRTPEEIELLKLRKENQRLKMENDILKQAALILAQK